MANPKCYVHWAVLSTTNQVAALFCAWVHSQQHPDNRGQCSIFHPRDPSHPGTKFTTWSIFYSFFDLDLFRGKHLGAYPSTAPEQTTIKVVVQKQDRRCETSVVIDLEVLPNAQDWKHQVCEWGHHERWFMTFMTMPPQNSTALQISNYNI